MSFEYVKINVFQNKLMQNILNKTFLCIKAELILDSCKMIVFICL